MLCLGAFEVESEEAFEDLIVGEVCGPTVHGGHGGGERAVGVG